MARGKRVNGNIERAAAAAAAAVAASGREIELGDEALEDDPMEALLEMGADTQARFVVKCLQPYNMAGRLTTVSREELPTLADRLTDEFGPGKYEVFPVDGSGRYLPGRHAVITISPMARRTNGMPAGSSATAPPAPATGSAAPAAPVLPGQPAAISDYIREMEARNEQRRLEAREDRREFRQTMVALLTPILPKVLEMMFGRQPTLAEQVQMLGGLKQLAGGDASSAEKMMEVFMKGMEISQDMTSNTAPATGWSGVISEGLKIAGSLVGRPAADPIPPAQPAALPAPSAPAASPAAASPPAQPAAAAPTAAAASSLPEPWNQFEPLLREFARDVEAYAKNDIDPAVAVNSLLQKIPEEATEAIPPPILIPLLERPDWWQQVILFAPSLQGRFKYCDAIRQQVIQLIRQVLGGGEEEPAAAEATGA